MSCNSAVMAARATIASSPTPYLPIQATSLLAFGLKASFLKRMSIVTKNAGLNLYVGLTADSNLSLVQRNGMRAILQQSEWRTNQTAINSPAVAGWELFDEIDMQQGPVKATRR